VHKQLHSKAANLGDNVQGSQTKEHNQPKSRYRWYYGPLGGGTTQKKGEIFDIAQNRVEIGDHGVDTSYDRESTIAWVQQI
jgi:hypothetical protein